MNIENENGRYMALLIQTIEGQRNSALTESATLRALAMTNADQSVALAKKVDELNAKIESLRSELKGRNEHVANLELENGRLIERVAQLVGQKNMIGPNVLQGQVGVAQ